VTLRPAATATIRAADHVVRSARSGRTGPGSTRTAADPARVVADQRRTIRTGRSGSGPVRRTAPGTRTGSRTTIRDSRSAAG
jgi:hypothetical protein